MVSGADRDAREWARPSWRPRTRGRGWRRAGGWWPGSTPRTPGTCWRAWPRWPRPWGCLTAVPGRRRPMRASWSGTGWRLTGAVACWCSMTRRTLRLLRPFVPAVGAARVLITGTREPVAELGTSVPVDVFSAEEALALLDGRTGLADEAGASAVAAELGHLPLALDQAAAVIAGQHLGYASVPGRAAGAAGRGVPGRKDEGAAVPAGRGGSGTVVLGGDPGRRPGRGVHRSHGDHGHAVGGRGPLRAAARRRAGGHTARRRAPGGRGHGGPGTGAAERTVTAEFQPGRPGRQRAPPGGTGSPRELARRGATRGMPGRRLSPGNARRGTAEPRDRAAVRDILGRSRRCWKTRPRLADDADERLATMLMRLRFLGALSPDRAG